MGELSWKEKCCLVKHLDGWTILVLERLLARLVQNELKVRKKITNWLPHQKWTESSWVVAWWDRLEREGGQRNKKKTCLETEEKDRACLTERPLQVPHKKWSIIFSTLPTRVHHHFEFELVFTNFIYSCILYYMCI